MSRLPRNRSRTVPGSVFVAVLAKRGKVYEAESVFGDEDKAFVGRKSLDGARTGELVLLKADGRGRGEVVRRLGPADSLPVIMEAIMAHYRVPRGFSQKAQDEAAVAAELAMRPDPERQDLTGLFSFTIDPDEARDFDDAISLVDGPGEDEITLYVHIADVSYYVAPGSALDSGARQKACSVYMPVAVEPMLPPVLSSDACSLKPGVERKCVTVQMVYRLPDTEMAGSGATASADAAGPGDKRQAGGKQKKKKRGKQSATWDFPREQALRPPPLEPVKVHFFRSTIRSRRRLTYNEVDDLFEGKAALGPARGANAADSVLGTGAAAGDALGLPGDDTASMETLLDRCRSFAGILRAARHARGALNIQTFEPEFRLDDEGGIIGVRPRPESESHALIEEFMIAANEAVARFLERRKSECIYRVHEEPDAQAVDSLFELMADLGIATPPFSLAGGTAQAAGEAIREMLRRLPAVLSEQQRDRSVFGELVLRSLKQAIYLEDNLGHFGLASPAYLHFTSPIRRYPDLVVHRALLRELGLEDFACDRLQLAETARVSSENERRASLVERTANDVALAFLLDRLLYEEGWDSVFEGEIVSVIPSGLFVRFERCYEGYVHARKLWGDYFAISDKGSSLVGRRHGRPFRLGDRLSVRVVRIDKLRGKVELEPAR
ncbi:MAG: ribonuclease R family protein [Thermoleophilia bacterium]